MISIIVPVYDVELYIHQCIDSILNQTYKDIEVLLVDDGSPDRCGEICDQYATIDSRVRVFHTENHGLSSARNLGLREAKGDYIGFVDSDDWIEPDMYETLLNGIEQYDADISTCGLWYEKTKATIVFQYPAAFFEGTDSTIALIDRKINNAVWNKLYHRNVFDHISFPIGKNFEDIIVTTQVINKAKTVISIPKPKYHYRYREEGISKNYSMCNLLDYADACISRFYYFQNETPDIAESKREMLLLQSAKGLSRLWRWWFGCTCIERRENKDTINELSQFTKDYIPLFGFSTWPVSLRVTSVFMHNNHYCSFVLAYFINQIYRMVCPKNSNVSG